LPHGYWKTSTFVAGLRCDRVTAPLVIDGAMNGELFLAYIEQILAPTLSSGDVVIMDNLSSHKIADVRQAIEARGATLLYLPAYSPDLNPIEQAFAKLKSLLRTAAARSVDALCKAIGNALQRFGPTELPPIFLDTDLSDRRQYGEVHMWTAPSSQGVLQCFDQIACAHMSGLLARSHMNAGQDGFRDRVPNSMAT
jgi:transposase